MTPNHHVPPRGFSALAIFPKAATVTILISAASPVTDFAARYLSETQLAEFKRPVMERATTLVNALRDEFINEGYPVLTQIQMNHVTDTIVKSIEANHDQLLVIGSRELTKSERLHLGVPCADQSVAGSARSIFLTIERMIDRLLVKVITSHTSEYHENSLEWLVRLDQDIRS